jgi:hypothetical protein
MTDPSGRDLPAAIRNAFRATLVVGAVLPLVPSMLGQLPDEILTAAALLLIAAGCLLVSSVRGRDRQRSDFVPAAVAAAPGILILAITLYPAMIMLVVAPLLWVTAIWAGVPDGLGITPPWSTYPVEVVFDGRQPIAVAIAATAAGVAAFAILRERRAVLRAIGLVLPVSLPLTLIVADVRWPAVSLAMLAVGSGLTAAATIDTVPMWQRVTAGTQGLSYVAAGAAGCLATPVATILALTLITIIAAWTGWRGRSVVRPYACVFAVGIGAISGAAIMLAAGQSRVQAAFGVLTVAVVALVCGVAIRADRRDEAQALSVSAHLAMIAALFLTVGSLSAATLLCAIWTAALTARIWWPGVSTVDRRFLVVPAAAWATVTWWLVLGPPVDAITEQYTLPPAGVALLLGWATRRRFPITKAWAAYGPAAFLAVLPTASLAAETADEWRWIAVATVVSLLAVLLIWPRRARTPANGV